MIDRIKPAEQLGKVVSLFSGAGGLDYGFWAAGFQPIWANDIDPLATKTYTQLLPGHNINTGDLTKQKLPKVKGLDLVIGGPPCQGFSVAGRMDPSDPRSKHVWNFLGVVDRLRPTAFIMENVKALATNSRWAELRSSLVKKAVAMGYHTELFVLNAAHFGVPQARERMFLIGSRKGKVTAPAPVSKDNPPVVRQALNALPKFGTEGNHSVCTAKISPAKNPVLRSSPFAGMLFNGQGRPLHLDMPALTLPASMGGNRTPIIDQSQFDGNNKNSWIDEYHKHLLKGGEPYSKVPSSLRRITVEEAAAIQTFPRGLDFKGTQTAKYRQIGNAVPPLLAYHVALAMRQSLYFNV